MAAKKDAISTSKGKNPKIAGKYSLFLSILQQTARQRCLDLAGIDFLSKNCFKMMIFVLFVQKEGFQNKIEFESILPLKPP